MSNRKPVTPSNDWPPWISASAMIGLFLAALNRGKGRMLEKEAENVVRGRRISVAKNRTRDSEGEKKTQNE